MISVNGPLRHAGPPAGRAGRESKPQHLVLVFLKAECTRLKKQKCWSSETTSKRRKNQKQIAKGKLRYGTLVKQSSTPF